MTTETFGFIGAILMIALYTLLIIRTCMLAVRAKDDFGTYIHHHRRGRYDRLWLRFKRGYATNALEPLGSNLAGVKALPGELFFDPGKTISPLYLSK